MYLYVFGLFIVTQFDGEWQFPDMRKYTSVALNMINLPNVVVLLGQRHNEGLYQ